MPPKKAAGISENELFLLSIIKHNIEGSIKYDGVQTELGGDKTVNALRKKYNRLRATANSVNSCTATEATDDGDGEEDGGAVKPAAAKKRAPAKKAAKKRKVEELEETEEVEAEVEDEDGAE